MTETSALDYRFDSRVVDRYDALRGHPTEVSALIGQTIADLTGERARVLELGVGTGRIALPAAAAGCLITGIDASSQMLSRLVAQAGSQPLARLHLVRGDISALPFLASAFDAVLAVHVLHLVADWASVLDQVSRLIRPGGRLLLGRDWIDPDSFSGQIRNEFRRTVVEVGTDMLPPGATAAAPPAGGAAIVQKLSGLGARAMSPEETVAAEWTTRLAPRQVLDGIRSRDDAESWVLPDKVLAETMRRLDRFAAKQWPDLDEPLPVTRRFMIGVFEF
ncbi:MAG: class I SAM-dependent methyltransferase [Wenzhouxiangella sp.]|jgi:SAM-dependent methyltransferase|nr:class I SAM-dependent methyltransferase [Wenzhouxiangella sp.]